MSVSESRRFPVRPDVSCRDVDAEAIRYFFNGLPKRRRDAVRSHLARCARCRKKLGVFACLWARARKREPRDG